MNLETKNTFFTQTTFIERINPSKLNAIINCDKALNHSKIWWEDLDLKYENGTICCEKDHLKMMRQACRRDSNGIFTLKTKYGSKVEYGRVYPLGMKSLGILRREVRHFLCEGTYYDVDMINAHFQIAKGLCKKIKFKCPKIDEYIENRDTMLLKYQKLYGGRRGDNGGYHIRAGSQKNGGGRRELCGSPKPCRVAQRRRVAG